MKVLKIPHRDDFSLPSRYASERVNAAASMLCEEERSGDNRQLQQRQ